MTIQEAIKEVDRQFPFKKKGIIKQLPDKKYMSIQKDCYFDIAKTVCTYLSPAAKILDFGAGPAEKTAILSKLGFDCSAFDDLQDSWHKEKGNREKILEFAKKNGVKFYLDRGEKMPFRKNYFDMVMIHDVLEHWHDSPKNLLTKLLNFLKPGGYIFITIPNAVNIRKRLFVLFGKTNYPSFEEYFYHPDPWRGHVREYVRDDLDQLCNFFDLEIIKLESRNYMISNRLSGPLKYVYLGITSLFPWWRDTLLLVARKK